MNFDSLPVELIQLILIKAGINDICRYCVLRRVCADWNGLFYYVFQNYIKLQLQKEILNFTLMRHEANFIEKHYDTKCKVAMEKIFSQPTFHFEYIPKYNAKIQYPVLKNNGETDMVLILHLLDKLTKDIFIVHYRDRIIIRQRSLLYYNFVFPYQNCMELPRSNNIAVIPLQKDDSITLINCNETNIMATKFNASIKLLNASKTYATIFTAILTQN